jgi:hypothetical protein
VKDVESPNSCTIIEVNLDEIALILGGNSPVFHLPMAKVTPFHVIFDLNASLITTHINKGKYGKLHFALSFFVLDRRNS